MVVSLWNDFFCILAEYYLRILWNLYYMNAVLR